MQAPSLQLHNIEIASFETRSSLSTTVTATGANECGGKAVNKTCLFCEGAHALDFCKRLVERCRKDEFSEE